MQVPPPSVTSELPQKLRVPPPSCVKVQHRLLPGSLAQSALVVQSGSCSVPEQVKPPSLVGHADAGLHEEVTVPLVQLGGLPPVRGTSVQQTCPGQSEGLMHPEDEPPLLLLDPLLLPLAPLLLPLPPLLLPLPPPLLLALPLLLPLPAPLLLLAEPLLLPLPPLLPPLPLPLPPPLLLLPPPVELLPLLQATTRTEAARAARRRVMGCPPGRAVPRDSRVAGS